MSLMRHPPSPDSVQAVARMSERLYTVDQLLSEAADWFELHRPEWGPGTLPTWYTDACRALGRLPAGPMDDGKGR